MYTRALLAFLDNIGIDRTSLRQGDREVETLDRYTLLIRPPFAGLTSITSALCQDIVNEFRLAITLRLGDSSLPALEISRGQLPSDLSLSIGRAQTTPAIAELLLEIDKKILIGQLLPSNTAVLAKYYLFATHAARFLGSTLLDLDAQLFSEGKPTILIVGDAHLCYTGPILTIVGEAELDATTFDATALPQRLRARLDTYRHVATEQLSWVGFSLAQITPLHCLSTPRGVGDPAFSTILDRHLLHLSILYSANRTGKTDSGYDAVYASSDRTITLSLALDDILPEHRLLNRFALWPYESGAGSDRLTVLQTVIARELNSPAETPNLAAFTAQLPHLLMEARWNHRTFIDKQIDQHFVQLRAARDYVAETTKKVGDAVDTVTKGLTEVLLAAIGVIVAALLAALAKPQEEGRIVGTIMGLYAVYLALQAVLRLGSTLHSVVLLYYETTVRLDDLRLALGKSTVVKLARPLVLRWWQFGIWLGISAILFLVLALGAVNWVPGFVTSAVPTTSATPSATATPKP